MALPGASLRLSRGERVRHLLTGELGAFVRVSDYGHAVVRYDGMPLCERATELRLLAPAERADIPGGQLQAGLAALVRDAGGPSARAEAAELVEVATRGAAGGLLSLGEAAGLGRRALGGDLDFRRPEVRTPGVSVARLDVGGSVGEIGQPWGG
jgi:hypothetical protein